MIILGADPGSVNYALACIKFDAKARKLEVLGSRMLQNPINKFDDTLQSQFDAFIKELQWIRGWYKPDYAIMERFQTRGNGGNTIEFVSMMNGMLYRVMRKSDPMLVTASTWKNACTRAGIDLKALYVDYKMKSVYSPKAIHEFDAVMMAVYRWYIAMNVVPYKNFDVHKFIAKFMDAPTL